MQACVTGGAGFIGSHLVERLVRDGATVTVLDNLHSGRRENLAAVADAVTFVEGDVRNVADCAAAVAGCEVVYHLAALASVERSIKHPQEAVEVNLGGTLHMLDAARKAKVRRFVLAGSSSIYGDTEALPKAEDLPLRPLSPYAASKAGAESFVHAYQRSYDLEAVILRFFNVYGPRQSHTSRYAGAIPVFLSACLDGRAATLYGDGEQTRDFTFVSDVVEALVRAATAPRATEGPTNIGAGRRQSVRALLAAIEKACGRPLRLAEAPQRTGDIRDSEADIRRAADVLGWSPTVGLDEGLLRTVKALRAHDHPVEPSG